MSRLSLFKALSCSLLALNVASNLPTFGGKLTNKYNKAQILEEKRSISVQAIKKTEDQLIKENNQSRVTKLETKLKRWKERLEDIEKKEANSHGGQSSELSSFGMDVDQQLLRKILPHEMLLNIFGFLSPKALSRAARVCKDWKDASNDNRLWRNFLRPLGLDIPNNIEPKHSAISALKVSTVNSIITERISTKVNDRLIELGYIKAINRKFLGLSYGDYGYDVDLKAAKSLNEVLIAQGDPEAIYRKVLGLAEGKYGYEKDPKAAKCFNEERVAQGDPEAINRKVAGLSYGDYGYDVDLKAAKSLNEKFVAQGEPMAIYTKIKGLSEGKYGYDVDLEVAKSLNKKLVVQGDPEAINRKVAGLAYGYYGYDVDLEAAKSFNEELVAQGDPEAIARKVEGLAHGDYGYEADKEFLTKYISLLAD